MDTVKILVFLNKSSVRIELYMLQNTEAVQSVHSVLN